MWNAINRSTVMFALGASGFIHELLREGVERPFVLALCGALMGLPFVLAADGRLRREEKHHEDEEDRWSHLP